MPFYYVFLLEFQTNLPTLCMLNMLFRYLRITTMGKLFDRKEGCYQQANQIEPRDFHLLAKLHPLSFYPISHSPILLFPLLVLTLPVPRTGKSTRYTSRKFLYVSGPPRDRPLARTVPETPRAYCWKIHRLTSPPLAWRVSETDF